MLDYHGLSLEDLPFYIFEYFFKSWIRLFNYEDISRQNSLGSLYCRYGKTYSFFTYDDHEDCEHCSYTIDEGYVFVHYIFLFSCP